MKRLALRIPFPALTAIILFFAAQLHAAPQWIWTSAKAKEGERADFRTTFTVAGPVKSATLQLDCDNSAKALLNGKAVAVSADWKAPAKADVTKALQPGENTLLIEGKNNDGVAALVAVLTIETADGRKQVIESGPEWLGALAGATDFKPSDVIAKYGATPWGPVFEKPAAGSPRAPITPPAPADLQVA